LHFVEEPRDIALAPREDARREAVVDLVRLQNGLVEIAHLADREHRNEQLFHEERAAERQPRDRRCDIMTPVEPIASQPFAADEDFAFLFSLGDRALEFLDGIGIDHGPEEYVALARIA